MERLNSALKQALDEAEKSGACLECPLYQSQVNRYVKELTTLLYTMAYCLEYQQPITEDTNLSNASKASGILIHNALKSLIHADTQMQSQWSGDAAEHQLTRAYNLLLQRFYDPPEELVSTSYIPTKDFDQNEPSLELKTLCPTQHIATPILGYIQQLTDKRNKGSFDTLIFDLDYETLDYTQRLLRHFSGDEGMALREPQLVY